MNSEIIKPPVPCPVCGADSQYRVWRGYAGEGSVQIRSEKHAILGSVAKPLVCMVCGYVQLFVNPDDFRE